MTRPALKFYEGDEDSPPRVTGVPVFREGDYSPQGKYTADHVQQMAATYDPAFLEAPLTPDHEQTGPAWGWWERFYTVNTPEGLELYGDCKLLFVGEWMWKSGMYKRRSIEIYRDIELPNGEEGHYVKAVSLLGAATPAVKGLQNMFSAMPKSAKAAKLFGMPAFVDHKNRKEVSVQAFSVDAPDLILTPSVASHSYDPNNVPRWPMPPGYENAFLLPSLNGSFTQTLPDPANNERKEPEMGDLVKQPTTPGQSAQVDAAQFAEMKQSMEDMKQAAEDFKQQAADFKKQAEETRNQLQAESAKRTAAEALAFNAAEDKRFDDALKANADKVTPAVGKRLRALFHACPPDSETDRHVSFKDGANDKTLSMRGLILDLMSAGGKVIDLNTTPENDNTGAENKGDGAVPAYDTKEFFDRVDSDARKLQKEHPDKYKSYTEAADEAHRALMRQQPAGSFSSSKRRSIPKAAD